MISKGGGKEGRGCRIAYRISSCASCLDLPFSTSAMMMFSVAMNGSSSSTRRSMMALLTTRPLEMLFSCIIPLAW